MKRRSIVLGIGGAVIAAIAYVSFALLPREEGIPKLVIYLDQDRCHRCNMLISNMRYAAAIFIKGEKDLRKYDDIGCMLAEYNEEDRDRISAVIVHDYFDGRPLKVEEAWFVVAPRDKLATPMGYGVVAFASYDDAKRLAAQYNGEVMDWKGIINNIEQIINIEKPMKKH